MNGTDFAARYTEAIDKVIADSLCEECDAPAHRRVAGEQDSFGTEWLYLCHDCANALADRLRAEHEAEAARRVNTPCAWCREDSDTLELYKEYDANSWDERKWVCRTCRMADRKAADYESCGYDMDRDRRENRHQECWCGGGHVPEYWCDAGWHVTEAEPATRTLRGSLRSWSETICPTCSAIETCPDVLATARDGEPGYCFHDH